MKIKWGVKKLVEIGKIFSGNSINEKIKKERYENINEGLPYIATKDISYNFEIDYNNGIKIPETEITNFRISHKNSIFICAEGGSAGRKMAFNNQDVCFVNKLFTLEPFNSIEPKFVYYFYQTKDFQKQFRSLITGLIGGVSMNKFKEIEIPLPPISEQKHIIKILDESFEIISKAKENSEKNLKSSNELFESYLQSIFANPGKDWEEKNLGEICEDVTVGHVGSMATKYKDKGIPFLRSQNIKPYQISLADVVFIDQEFNKQLKKSQLKPGDLAIVRTGYPGTAAVIPKTLLVSNCSDLVIVRPGKLVDPYFLSFFFNSTYGKKLVLGNIVGAAQKHFNIKAAIKVLIPVPPLIEQQKIIAKLNALSDETKKIEAIYQHKLNNLEELKKSILQKAFNGELVKE